MIDRYKRAGLLERTSSLAFCRRKRLVMVEGERVRSSMRRLTSALMDYSKPSCAIIHPSTSHHDDPVDAVTTMLAIHSESTWMDFL